MWIVTLNGNSQMFRRRHSLGDQLHRWSQGGDTFTNNTSLNEVAVMYGGGNQVVGGSGFNVV